MEAQLAENATPLSVLMLIIWQMFRWTFDRFKSSPACIPTEALKKISEMYHWVKELRDWHKPNDKGQQPWREPSRSAEIERGIKDINAHLETTADVQKRTEGLLEDIRDSVKAWPQAGA